MKRLLVVSAVVAVTAVPGPAPAATKTYSSGALNQAIPNGGVVEQGLRVRDRGPVSHLSVSLRIDHPHTGQLTLELIAPSGKTVVLAAKRGATGANFGKGAGCGGQLTVFDDEFGDPLSSAVPPFVDGSLEPEQKLARLYGEQAEGKWRLRVTDDAAGGVGVIRCVELDVSRNVLQHERARGGPVSADLSFRETNYRYFGVHLRIEREGRSALSASLAQVTCAGCPSTGVLFTSEGRALRIRDLDSDGEPEVVLDLYTGGLHCCSYSLIFRYRPKLHDYRRLVAAWGNAGYGLLDYDHDGRPELVSADDRFAYEFTAYAASAFPPRIWHYDHGRQVDITRKFPRLVEQDARRLWQSYLTVRDDEYPDVRGVLAAYMADQYLLGREEEGWRRLDGVLERGELGPARLDSLWPVGAAYIRKLHTFLREKGYAP